MAVVRQAPDIQGRAVAQPDPAASGQRTNDAASLELTFHGLIRETELFQSSAS
jgi:hypothetical protein